MFWGFQGVRVSGFQDVLGVSGCQGFRVSGCFGGFTVFWGFRVSRVSGFQGFRVQLVGFRAHCFGVFGGSSMARDYVIFSKRRVWALFSATPGLLQEARAADCGVKGLGLGEPENYQFYTLNPQPSTLNPKP